MTRAETGNYCFFGLKCVFLKTNSNVRGSSIIMSTLSKAYSVYAFFCDPLPPSQKSTLQMLIFNDLV